MAVEVDAAGITGIVAGTARNIEGTGVSNFGSTDRELPFSLESDITTLATIVTTGQRAITTLG